MITKQKSRAGLLLVMFLAVLLIDSRFFAVTVDFYQDCESGNNGDTFTSAIMND